MKYLVILGIALLLIIGGATALSLRTVDLSQTPPPPSFAFQFNEKDASIHILKDGKETQKIPLSEEIISAVQSWSYPEKILLIDKKEDINFDGSPDIAVLVGTGYMGLNLFYDYYVSNPETGMYVQDPVLTHLGNPEFYPEKREIFTSFKSGTDQRLQTYVWKNNGYVGGGEVSGYYEEE